MPVSSAPDSNARTRSGFALTGPSVVLDPRIHAVRPDLADIRLAGQVFAPHFAASIACRAVDTGDVSATPKGDVAVATLVVGDRFDVLEVSGDLAWGIAADAGLVGYVDRHLLEIDE